MSKVVLRGKEHRKYCKKDLIYIWIRALAKQERDWGYIGRGKLLIQEKKKNQRKRTKKR